GMTSLLGRGAKRSRTPFGLVVLCALLLPLLVAAPGSSATAGADDFNRADGGLGAAWSPVVDAGVSISSQVVVGVASGFAGAIRTGEAYGGDQYSQVELTSTQLSGGQFVGPAVRMQSGGQGMYLGIYFWNGGSPELRMYKRVSGSFVQLGTAVATGPLASGTVLKLVASGSRLALSVNGVERVVVTDA